MIRIERRRVVAKATRRLKRASKLLAAKIGGLTKNSATLPESNQTSAARVRVLDDFNHPQCLRDCNFAAL